MNLLNNTKQGRDLQAAFIVFLICVLISFFQETGQLFSDGLAAIP